jgi:catechol 2,3-dioxygenase-like lactoylglutathione lyase family enzyme
MDRPAHIGLRHLALHARRLDEMTRFYVELLGFHVEWQPDADNVYLSSGTDNLALHRAAAPAGGTTPPHGDALAAVAPSSDRDRAARPRDTVLDHLGLIVRTADDVDRWAEFLAGRGVVIDAMPRTHRDGARSCYLRDPDGNVVQIIHHPPISGA